VRVDQWLQITGCGKRRSIRFVRLALKVVTQNDGDFVDVILL
jgi:ribosomal 50S subunit-recycling heat shock protein